MKKNKMMRLASVLLVLCLLTTSVISGTFAKYVTTDSANDTARVAKFGVVATVSGDLFGATYLKAEDNTITSYAKNPTNGETVSSADEAMVVAPGTENLDGLKLFITGTPEVSTKVYFDAAEDDNGVAYADSDIYLDVGTYGVMVEYKGVITKDNFEEYYICQSDGVYVPATMGYFIKSDTVYYELHDVAKVTKKYYPLTWYMGTEEMESQAALKTELTDFFNGKKFKPNEALDALTTTVGWSWSYGTARTEAEENITDEDKQDTILGNMIASHLTDGDAAVKIVKMDDSTSKCYPVSYEPKDIDATTVIVAKAQNKEVACLTAAFNARLTVEQVD